MGVNDPSGKYDELNSPFMRIMFQIYSSAAGDKNIPVLDETMSARSEGYPAYQQFLMYFIYLVYFLQQCMFTFAFFYYICMVWQSYEKNYPRLVTLVYKQKAQFNDECYDIMDIFYK